MAGDPGQLPAPCGGAGVAFRDQGRLLRPVSKRPIQASGILQALRKNRKGGRSGIVPPLFWRKLIVWYLLGML